MTTAADMVSETRQHLLHWQREQINRLAASLTSGATEVTFDFPLNGIAQGAVISVGLERMHVWSVTSDTATVERGWDGTTAAAHSDGAIVRVNSRSDDFAIFRALNEDIVDLSSPMNGLFRVRTVDLTYATTTYGYNLASDMLGEPLMVQAEAPGGTGNWDRIGRDDYRFDGSADSTDFSSGKSLHLLAGGYPGRPVRVVYRAAFGALTALTDDVQAVTYLPATCNDIPPLGAAARLLAGRAVRRSDLDSQGSTRRAEEVSTTDALASPRGLLAQRESRIQAEASRLAASHPVLL